MENNSTETKSAYYSGSEYLSSINESLIMCKRFAVGKNFDGWLDWLLITYRELSAKTTGEEDKNIEEKLQEIYPLVNDPLLRKTESGKILNKLHKLEIFLRKKLQEKGMLLPDKEDIKYD